MRTEPRQRWSLGLGLFLLGAVTLLFMFTWPGLWALLPLTIGVAEMLVGFLWMFDTDCLVLWLPWEEEPVVYADPVVDYTYADYLRIRNIADAWCRVGRWQFLWWVLGRPSSRMTFNVWIGVCASTVTDRRGQGVFYDQLNGVRRSVIATEAEWLAGTMAARARGHGVVRCYDKIKSEIGDRLDIPR